MNLYVEYKHLARQLYNRRHFHEERGEINSFLINEYIDTAFEEIEDELDKECINIRTLYNNFTTKKDVFESLTEEMQIKIVNKLKELISFSNWIKYLREKLPAIDGLTNGFKKSIGKEKWKKLCDDYGSEELVIYQFLIAMVKFKSGENDKTPEYHIWETMSVFDMVEYICKDEK